MQFKPTLRDCAGIFDCSEDTISRYIQKYEGLSFFDFREKYLGQTRLKLQTKAIQMALGGDKVMLIFSLKNLCAWKDNPDFTLETDDSIIEFVD